VTLADAHDWTSAKTVLPPRPRLVDWALGGAAAGLLLGSAEATLVWLDGSALPPRLAGLAVVAGALLVAVLALLVGLVLRLLGRRPSHSALAGALVAPVLAAPVVAGAVGAAGSIQGAALGLALAGVAGVVAARLAARLEAGGIPVSGLLVLAPIALLAAIAEAGPRGLRLVRSPQLGLELAPWALALGALVLLAYALSLLGSRERALPPGFGATLVASALFAALTCALPVVVPFLMLDPTESVAVAAAPPNLLVLDLGRATSDPASNAGLESTRLVALASDGVRYDVVRRETPNGVASALLAGDGGSLLALLASRGYATAAVAPTPARVARLGAAELDVRRGPGGRLKETAPRMSGAALLAALPPAPRGALGVAAPLRSDVELASDAGRWLGAWRATRARVPFCLVVDFGDDGPPPSDAALARLLDPLHDLDAGTTTLVLAGAASPPGVEGGGTAPFRLLAVPPLAAKIAPRGVRVLGHVDAADFAAQIRALPERRADAPFPLPAVGLTGALGAEAVP